MDEWRRRHEKAEMPERAGGVGGGTAESTEVGASSTHGTAERSVGDGTSGLTMEEVLRRENLMAAYERSSVRNGGAGASTAGVRRTT